MVMITKPAPKQWTKPVLIRLGQLKDVADSGAAGTKESTFS